MTGKFAPSLAQGRQLSELWRELRALAQKSLPVDRGKKCPALADVVQQLNTIDPQSFVFSYPTTNKGKFGLPDLRRVNVRYLNQVMNSI
jgi:hypothetical protein